MTERALMQFRYMASWLYWLLIGMSVTAQTYVMALVILGLKALAPSLLKSPPLFLAISIPLVLCAFLPIFALAFRLHARIHRFYPARPLVLTEEGISFDLSLGISGFVAWRDVARVGRSGWGWWHVFIEFKHKLSIGPAGLERELSRLLLRGDRILPSGREFLKAAQHYHAIASGQPETAERLGEPRQSILRKLAWTCRRPAR
ncbi:MAG TPA: hypothetical protein VIU82_15220 [Bosea sp. (in: a-proteobacteria)]